MARKAWGDLSDEYRSRLLRAGDRRGLSPSEVRRYHEAGDLREFRGHAPKVRGAAPREATDRAALGLDTSADKAVLDRWRRSSAPAWIPKNRAAIGDDTAAVLSQIDVPPEKWKETRFVVLTDGRVQMIVTPIRGYDRVVFLQDRDSMIDVIRLVRDPVSKGGSKTDKKRLERQWKNAHIRVNASGSDRRRRAAPVNGPLIRPERPERPSSSASNVPLPPSSTSSTSTSTSGSTAGRKKTAPKKAAAKKAAAKKAAAKKAAKKQAAPRKATSTRKATQGTRVPSTDVVGLVEEVLNATPEQLDAIARILRGDT